MPKFLGRDPAVILGFVSAGVQMLVAFGLHMSDNQTASLNAVAAAVLGVATAYYVAKDRVLPAVVGLIQAALTLGLAFGLDWSANQVAMLMAFVAAGAALFGVRPQVTAVVGPDGAPVAKQSLRAG